MDTRGNSGWVEGEVGKGGQIYGNRRKDFRQTSGGEHTLGYTGVKVSSCTPEKLCNVINPCYPNKLT